MNTNENHRYNIKLHQIPLNAIRYQQIQTNPNESQRIPKNPYESLWIPKNPYKYHRTPLNIIKYQIPNTIQYQKITSNTIKYKRIPRNPNEFYPNPMFIPRCYIHLRWRFSSSPSCQSFSNKLKRVLLVSLLSSRKNFHLQNVLHLLLSKHVSTSSAQQTLRHDKFKIFEQTKIRHNYHLKKKSRKKYQWRQINVR